VSEQEVSGKHPASINVYPLVPAAELAGQANEIANALGQPSVTVAQVSGCVSYADHERLWQNNSGAGLPSAAAAEQAARSFMERANERAAATQRTGGKRGLPALFPRIVRTVSTSPVYAAGAFSPDHWLVQFMGFLSPGGVFPGAAGVPQFPKAPDLPQPHLDTTAAPSLPYVTGPASPPSPTLGAAEPDAPVAGGLIDVRIGAGSEVIGLWSRWRPHRAVQIAKRLSPPANNDSHHGEHTDPLLVYNLEGDGEPQSFIAPYYALPGGHHGPNLFPASEFSILADIGQRDSDGVTEVVALVAGIADPNSLDFAWGVWRLDRPASDGLEAYGSSPSILLEPGAHNVVLDIVDRRTGAIARTERTVYAGIPAERETQKAGA
jgi:hypothetical protein